MASGGGKDGRGRGHRHASSAVQPKDEAGRLIQPSSEAPVNYPAVRIAQPNPWRFSRFISAAKRPQAPGAMALVHSELCESVDEVLRPCTEIVSFLRNGPDFAHPSSAFSPFEAAPSRSCLYAAELLPRSKHGSKALNLKRSGASESMPRPPPARGHLLVATLVP